MYIQNMSGDAERSLTWASLPLEIQQLILHFVLDDIVHDEARQAVDNEMQMVESICGSLGTEIECFQ